MHVILSQSQLDQLDPRTVACTLETSETPEWHALWWCIRNVPGDLCRYLYFMRFSLLLWLFLPTLALLDINAGIASIARGTLTPYSPVQCILTGFTVVLPGWFALLAARIVCSYGPKRYASAVPPCFVVYDRMETPVFLGAQLHGKPSERQRFRLGASI